MKKKISVICAVGMMVTMIVTNHEDARAESREIQSQGNLMFRDRSQTAICSSDIQYLKEELDRLFGEILNGQEE